jgi:hypothetical protein
VRTSRARAVVRRPAADRFVTEVEPPEPGRRILDQPGAEDHPADIRSPMPPGNQQNVTPLTTSSP